ASRSGSLTSMRTSANKDWASGTNERWDINGRLLLGFDGYQRLLGTLIHLRNLGNTVIVVEHDEDAIRAAEHVIDIGPGAGVH
ncbi:carbohydrate porin, partial [Salmonella enterica subsp. enterica serovar Anatum]|nr:carbohydrate porin [Salmonella enterica subsp. enterica serovar Anatum]